jgi:exopolysaccharide biosynthesis polyprenyl glycosylphosphotransferase
VHSPMTLTRELGFRIAVPRPQKNAAVHSGVPWRRRYLLMLRLTDGLLIAATMVASTIWLDAAPHQQTTGILLGHAAVAVFIAVVWFGMTSLMRTRDPRLIGVGAGEYKRVVDASAATFGLVAVCYVFVDSPGPRGFFFLTWPAGLILLLAGRWAWRKWLNYQSRFGHYLSKVIVMGNRHDVRYVVAQIARKSGAAYDVVGVALEGKLKFPALQVGKNSVPVLGNLDTIQAAVAASGADAVIVAGQLHRGNGYIQQLSWDLEKTSTELVVASALTNVAGPRIRVRPVEGLPLMHVELPSFTGGRHVIKRCLDVLGSLSALIILSPVIAMLVAAVKLDSRGPGFFVQERVGKGGRTFRMYKLRSMVVSAEDELAQLRHLSEGNSVLFKLRDDPRVTRVGRWIRKYSLDELPQLYNVLRGDMSLVGPRPPLHEEVSKYETHTHRRLFIKPGCTGLWQINGRSDLDWEESVRLDLYYVENWSVLGDLIIMWRTAKVMLNPVGAY